MISRKKIIILMPWLVMLATLVLWELVCLLFHIRDFILPTPIDIAEAMSRYFWAILYHSWWTLRMTLIGFIIAIVGGTVLGVAIGYSTLVYKGLYPLLIAFNAVPKVAIVPILVLWFGIGAVPAIITAFIIAFFPIVVNVATGIATLEPELADVLRSLGASDREVLMKVGIPRALPYLFASLKIAVALSFVGSILAETIAGTAGLGYLMVTASARFDVPLVFSGLIAVSIMAVGLYAVCALFEKRLTRWAFRGELKL